MVSYYPVFSKISETFGERWQELREFIDNFFETPILFGDITIYEKENIIRIMHFNVHEGESNKYYFCFEMWKVIDVYSLPEAIL